MTMKMVMMMKVAFALRDIILYSNVKQAKNRREKYLKENNDNNGYLERLTRTGPKRLHIL